MIKDLEKALQWILYVIFALKNGKRVAIKTFNQNASVSRPRCLTLLHNKDSLV
jgi:hypothetical protein